MSFALWKQVLTSQYGAAMDMMENALRACPDAHWDDASVPVAQRFWYLAFHTLWWHDHYLAGPEGTHVPPEPFTLDELDPAGVYPATAYPRELLLRYLEHGRGRYRARLGALTEAEAAGPSGFARRDMSWLELSVYNLRHVQHHTAQLNLLLRQRIDDAPRWVGRGR